VYGKPQNAENMRVKCDALALQDRCSELNGHLLGEVPMQKLQEVQAAKDLMNEAMEWSTFKWLFEKPKVRQAADRANAVLDEINRRVKARWGGEAKAAYKKLSGKKVECEGKKDESQQIRVSTIQLVEKVIVADKAAHRARMVAEETFDEAEKKLSTSLAKEGCKRAIRSWILHEKAIRAAEALEGERVAE
jgi:hypothetical protein